MISNILFLVAVTAHSATFSGIGSFECFDDKQNDCRQSQVNGISADGSTIVGASTTSRSWNNPPLPGTNRPFHSAEAFKWTLGQGMQTLDTPEAYSNGNYYFSSRANAVSGDGKVIVGDSITTDTLNTHGNSEGVFWDKDLPVETIGLLPAVAPGSPAFSVSMDGTKIGGRVFHELGTWSAYVRPTVHGGDKQSLFQIVKSLTGVTSGAGWGISTVSNYVAGQDSIYWGTINIWGNWMHYFCPTPTRASFNEGISNPEFKEIFFDDHPCGWVNGISPDGKTYFGVRSRMGHESPDTSLAFMWSAEDVIDVNHPSQAVRRFGPSPIAGNFNPKASDWNASRVVGQMSQGNKKFAYIWSKKSLFNSSQPGALVPLEKVIRQLGINLTGWQLTEARGISLDGNVIVGNGIHNGKEEGWRLVLR